LVDKKIKIKLFYKWDLLCFESILQYPDFITPFIFIIMLLIKLRLRLEYLKSRHKSGPTNDIYFTSFEFSRTILFGHRKELFVIAWIISNHYDYNDDEYLYDYKFILVIWSRVFEIVLFNIKLISRLVRWRLKIADYEYEIVYKSEKINAINA